MQTTSKPKRKRNVPKWLAPAGIGLGLVGIGLASRRASAKSSKSSEGTIDNSSSNTETIPERSPAPPAEPDIVFPVYEGQDGAFMLQELLKAPVLMASGGGSFWRRRAVSRPLRATWCSAIQRCIPRAASRLR